MYAAQCRKCPQCRERGQAAACKRDRMQRKAFGLDRRCAVLHPGGDVHVEAGIARGARHRQPVRQESPILRSDVKEPRRRSGRITRGRRRIVTRICIEVSQAAVPNPLDRTRIDPSIRPCERLQEVFWLNLFLQ